MFDLLFSLFLCYTIEIHVHQPFCCSFLPGPFRVNTSRKGKREQYLLYSMCFDWLSLLWKLLSPRNVLLSCNIILIRLMTY